jgi:hypothetical protein
MSNLQASINKIGKILFLSLQSIAIVTAVCIVYGLFSERRFTLAYVFTGNFIAAAIITAAGVVIWFLPVRLALRLMKSKLIDHTTYKDHYMDERKKKQDKALEIICIGIACTFITGLIELILWLLI